MVKFEETLKANARARNLESEDEFPFTLPLPLILESLLQLLLPHLCLQFRVEFRLFTSEDSCLQLPLLLFNYLGPLLVRQVEHFESVS